MLENQGNLEEGATLLVFQGNSSKEGEEGKAELYIMILVLAFLDDHFEAILTLKKQQQQQLKKQQPNNVQNRAGILSFP